MESQYQPIENYGVVGNLRTAALVGMNGSIDWLCLPHFDSPSVFAAILDDRKGGRFRIAPTGDHFQRKQLYWPDTNILVTRFLHDDGVGEIEDFMPVGGQAAGQLIRGVHVVRGHVPFRLECRPAFDYARATHQTHVDEHGARFDGPGLSLGLAAPVPLNRDGTGVVADFTLGAGQKAALLNLLWLPAYPSTRMLDYEKQLGLKLGCERKSCLWVQVRQANSGMPITSAFQTMDDGTRSSMETIT